MCVYTCWGCSLLLLACDCSVPVALLAAADPLAPVSEPTERVLAALNGIQLSLQQPSTPQFLFFLSLSVLYTPLSSLTHILVHQYNNTRLLCFLALLINSNFTSWAGLFAIIIIIRLFNQTLCIYQRTCIIAAGRSYRCSHELCTYALAPLPLSPL